MRVPFVKMEGAGNDYVFVDTIDLPFPRERAPELARRWSDRHFGIGSDGLILLERGIRSPIAMAMWNADGSMGAMCGNGLRCLARLARELGRVDVDRFAIDTASGSRTVELLRDAAGAIAAVRADLGPVRVAAGPIRVRVGERDLLLRCGDAGNPHAVLVIDEELEDYPVVAIGAALQHHALFPGGVNVEFVRVRADGSLQQRTFERGSGETMACGTGAAVAALAALTAGLVAGPDVRILLRGGELIVHCRDGSLVIAGPARTVFAGEIEL